MSPSNKIHLTRLYDAPVKTVWDAWTDPEQAAHWWGPRGFTITTHSKDLRPGGHWHYTMHGPNKVEYLNKTLFLEVDPYSRLVYDHGGNDERKPLFRVTVGFSDVNGKTNMDMTMSFSTPEAAEQSRGFIKKASGDSTWDRFAEYLEKKTSNKDVFEINRSFQAPRDTVYTMWTDPAHFTQWLPPTGFTMRFIREELRVGGTSFYEMSNGKMTMYGSVSYQELHRPDRIVYTQQFRDKDEKISRHPMAPTWPETMLTTVTLAEEGPDQTRVTVRWETYGKVTAEELAAFIKERGGMTLRWTGSFDKLEALLENTLKK